MKELFETLNKYCSRNTPVQVAAIVRNVCRDRRLSHSFRDWKAAPANCRFLFYSEPSTESSTTTRRRLIELENEVALCGGRSQSKSLQAREKHPKRVGKSANPRAPELVKRSLDESLHS